MKAGVVWGGGVMETKEVLIGILLGDAHIARRTSTGNSRLVYGQTAVAHKEYFNHVLSIFMPFCVKDYTPQSRTILDKRTNKSYSSISFTTMQLPCFNEYRNLFYNLDVKIVPENIYDLLTPSPHGGGRVSFLFKSYTIYYLALGDIFSLLSSPPSPIPHIFQPQAIKKYEEWGGGERSGI